MGGLRSAPIGLAGIPGSLLGGYCADRSGNLRARGGPLVVVAALLPSSRWCRPGRCGRRGSGSVLLIFGSSRLAGGTLLGLRRRARVRRHGDRPDADAGRRRRSFIPLAFGHPASHTSFDIGWAFLAVVSFAFALAGLAGRNLATAPAECLPRDPVLRRARPPGQNPGPAGRNRAGTPIAVTEPRQPRMAEARWPCAGRGPSPVSRRRSSRVGVGAGPPRSVRGPVGGPVVRNVGSWMQTVGAQRPMLALTGFGHLVALIQTAASRPSCCSRRWPEPLATWWTGASSWSITRS